MDIVKATKKPAVVEAVQWDGEKESAMDIIGWILSFGTFAVWIGPDPGKDDCPSKEYHRTHIYCPSCSFSVERAGIIIQTLEGRTFATATDYIIRGIEGEFYPCKASIFAESYELNFT